MATERFYDTDVEFFGGYRPWKFHTQNGGDSSNYPHFSKTILDFKEKRPGALRKFLDLVCPYAKGRVIAVVPGHNPAIAYGPLHVLAAALAEDCQSIDASEALVRTEKIAKLSTGGPRDPAIHLRTIKVTAQEKIRGRDVLLLDDVVTSGGSLAACARLLRRAGARSVTCLALGKTTH